MAAKVSTPSLRNNLAARFVADVYGLVTSLIAASVTARVLGPSGRGYYSSLVLLTVLLVQLFNAGLGEAAIVLPRRNQGDQRRAVSATVALVGPLSVVGAAVALVSGALMLEPSTGNERMALALAGLLVMLNTCSGTIAWFLVAKEKLVLVAGLTIASGTVTTVAMYGFVAMADLGGAGAILASILGCAAVLVPGTVVAARAGISLRPAWDGAYLRSAARFGIAVQLSNLLVQMASRLDLLLVFRIAGPASAGRYSVALTVGALVGSVPIAIAFASFPRLPGLSESEAEALIARLFRSGVATAFACAVALGCLSPFVLPLVFGNAYRGSIAPTLILLPGGILWSAQWILCRVLAARGNPKPLSVSFAASFMVMFGLDLVLIAPFGLGGAAVASLVSSAVGCLIATASCRHMGWDWRLFIPRLRDLGVMLSTVGQMAGALRRRGTSATPDAATTP